MPSRLGLAGEILIAIRERRQLWRLAQAGLLLDIDTCEIVEG